MRPFDRFRAAAGLAVLAFAGACSSTNNTVPPAGPSNPVGKYIKHVVVIVQENRSFENIFAGWPGADAPLYGLKTLPGGKVVKIKLHPVTYGDAQDICHLWRDALTAFDGSKMDAFNLERTNAAAGACGSTPIGDFPYAYLVHSEIEPYRDLASQYVLADHFFPTEFGTSFTAHQDLIAGTTQLDPWRSLVNTPSSIPWGCDALSGTTTQLIDRKREIFSNGPFPCFDRYPTIADDLDPAGVSWKYYAPALSSTGGEIWTAFRAIKNVWDGPDRSKIVTPDTVALSDFAKGHLPQVSWVIPDLKWADYPAVNTDYSPSWVGDLVDAIGKSPDWNSTAIVLLWDDWGGWYDNAPPPQLDYVGLAIRVPCVIISPYARSGYVSHTQYEYGSILKFIEEAFDLPSLHTTDARANSLDDSFDFTQKPRAFVNIPTKYPPSFFFNQPQSLRPPDND